MEGQTPPAAAAARTGWTGTLLQAGASLIWGGLGALLVVAGLRLIDPPAPPQRLATVDLVTLMQRFDQAAIEAVKQGDQAAMQKAIEDKARQAAALEKVLTRVAQERGVVLVQKQALLGGPIEDLTPVVAKVLQEQPHG